MKTYNSTKHNMKVYDCKQVPAYMKSIHKPVVYNGECTGNLKVSHHGFYSTYLPVAVEYIKKHLLEKLTAYHKDVCGCKIFKVELKDEVHHIRSGMKPIPTSRYASKRPFYVLYDELFEEEYGFNLKIRCKDVKTFHFNLDFHPFEIQSSENTLQATITPS